VKFENRFSRYFDAKALARVSVRAFVRCQSATTL
jgi:hypothetical protein